MKVNEESSGTFRLLLLALVVFFVYLPAMRAGFVFDDAFLILQNNNLSGDLWTLLTSHLWAGDPDDINGKSFYRPLFSLSIYFDYRVFGPNAAWWFHLHSLAWHLLSVCLLFILLRRMFGSKGALLGACVFAMHPVQTETVVWISARNDSMAASFCLLAMLQLSGEKQNKSSVFIGLLASLFAILSKENAILLPVWIYFICSGNKYFGSVVSFIGISIGLFIRQLFVLSTSSPVTEHYQQFLYKLPLVLIEQL